MIEGSEPVEFRALFNRWPESNEAKFTGPAASGTRAHHLPPSSVAKTVQTYFDAALMHANPQLAAELQMLDDGKSFKEIWYIQGGDMHKLNETRHGEFRSGDCYIVHYKYNVNSSEKNILYYWIV